MSDEAYKNHNIKYKSIAFAVFAAACYGVSSPLAKILLRELSPTLMAALLYLGAGIGMLIVGIYKAASKKKSVEASMTLSQAPFIIGMIVLDIAAPIFLMLGLTMTTAANASLLNNFEIVATSVIAFVFFKESIGKRMWIAITLITVSSILLTINDFGSLQFSPGSLFVILACISWGLENNCTRMLSLKDPLQIVVLKGFGSGLGSLFIYFLSKNYSYNFEYMFYALVLGFFAYGMSVFLYIKAQRNLGAARTSAYYAVAPFIGVLISKVFLKETLTDSFIAALLIMLAGTYFAVTENHAHPHTHIYEEHEHRHSHDIHHYHKHEQDLLEEHSHMHVHNADQHTHDHLQDLHHRHIHKD